MSLQPTKSLLRIGRRAGQQGPRSPVRDQAGIEKFATGTDSTHQPVEEPHAEDTPHSGLLCTTTKIPTKGNRQKWSREEYKDVMEAYYNASFNPTDTSTTKAAYNIWREKHPADRLHMDANKLSNVRRDIVKNNRLTDIELRAIQDRIRPHIPDNDAVITGSDNQIESDKQEDQTEQPVADIWTQIDPAEVHEETNERVAKMAEDIQKKWEICKEMPINERPAIPKIRRDHLAKEAIKHANEAIQDIKDKQSKPLNLTDINQLLYAAASSVAEAVGARPRKPKSRKRTQPKWKEKIEKEIQKLRGQLSLLNELENGSNVKEKKKKQLERKYNIKQKEDMKTAKETLKQQIQAKAQRIRRFEKRSRFFRQNKIFKEDAKKLYREMGKKQLHVNKPPAIEEVENFWSKIWEEDKQHNEEAVWIQQQEEQYKDVELQEWSDIDITETTAAINKTSNWKAPGIDGIANFWVKNFPSVHEDLTHAYNSVVKNPEECPEWLTQGTTYLLPKSEETENPKNYRPITCLPTMYKILTSIITNRTYCFLERHDILPAEQKGCRRGSYGCKDQLLINKAILEEVKSKKKNLSTAWVDYKKAFDSVPHSWIVKSLEICRVCPTVIRFITSGMKNWKTTLNLNHASGSLTSRLIDIRSGIFQGDSLSPLLFCIALAPLSSLLNSSTYGYKIQEGKLNHLFYMDDLKTYAKDDNEQKGLLTIVKTFSDDIKMEFGLDKCAKATFKRGKLTNTTDLELDVNTVIKELDQEGTYKYLGVNEGDGLQHSSMKEKIRKEYYRRVRMVLKSELNASNRITAINTLATPVVTYSFNIINWKLTEIKRLDTKTRKLLTMQNMHHPKADVDRMYLPRASGGRGLVQLELAFKTTTIGVHAYLTRTKDTLLHVVKQHEGKKKLYSIKGEAAKFNRELQIPDLPPKENELATSYAKRVKATAKCLGQKQLQNTWKDKALHGKYPKRTEEADVDQQKTHQWLRNAGLKAETEGLIIAAQDQSLATRSYRHRIIKDGTDPQCRICGKYEETINHIVSGCPELAKSEYMHRHDKVAAYIHWKICQNYKVKAAEKWYEHQPPTVIDTDSVTILWDMPVHTDRELKANKPDIIVKDKKEKRCMIIDVAVPSESNTSVKVTEKLSKYKDLEIEISRMWCMKTQTIPVVIGSLGLVKKGLEKFSDRIPGNIDLNTVQKIALLGTAHILRKILSMK